VRVAPVVAGVILLLTAGVGCAVDPGSFSSEGAPAGPTEVPGEQPVLLNPEDVEASVLDRLDSVWIPIGIPSDWRGPYTVCTKIDEGWNECLDLATPVPPVVQLGAYLGKERTLDVWLLDQNADPREPLQHLGRADLSFLSEERLTARSGLVIRLELAGSFSSGWVQDPTVTVGEVATWNDLLADPARYEAVTGDPYPT
jgi:hypothetical protein